MRELWGAKEWRLWQNHKAVPITFYLIEMNKPRWAGRRLLSRVGLYSLSEDAYYLLCLLPTTCLQASANQECFNASIALLWHERALHWTCTAFLNSWLGTQGVSWKLQPPWRNYHTGSYSDFAHDKVRRRVGLLEANRSQVHWLALTWPWVTSPPWVLVPICSTEYFSLEKLSARVAFKPCNFAISPREKLQLKPFWVPLNSPSKTQIPFHF